eukprot:4488006-Prymnesium_polylepis.1
MLKHIEAVAVEPRPPIRARDDRYVDRLARKLVRARALAHAAARQPRHAAKEGEGVRVGTLRRHRRGQGPVSYTHLTLPTICSV